MRITRPPNPWPDGWGCHVIVISMPEEQAATALPRYRSHKEVWALKIKTVTYDCELARLQDRETDGSLTIVPEDPGYSELKVLAKFVPTHETARPHAGWYWVRYDDGYESFSPSAAFEEGYTRI